jgi:glycosyltransferase involved in cell wall biosynthesis
VMDMKKLISVVTACYNEEENVELLYSEVKKVFEKMTDYEYEHIFIDNASKDRTVPLLKEIARNDKNVKIIVNARNFGHIRSPFYGLLQARGDAVISLVADFQDPPSMIPDFIKKWEEGYKIVVGVKNKSEENPLLFAVRKFYYKVLQDLSEVNQIKNFTGFGLYDQRIIEILRTIDDPYPYMRGLISAIGYDVCQIEYTQPVRKRGKTKNNFYSLYDMAMLGITNNSKVPLRLAALTGFGLAVISLFIAFVYTIYKLVNWDSFSVGIAPLVIGLFFFSSVQLFFIGVIGEYVGSIQTQVMKRPLVIERERVNFNEKQH